MLARAARPKGPERLSPLRPAASGGRALSLRVLPLVLLILVLAAATGCGGDEESSAETTPALPELTMPETDAGPEAAEPEPEQAPAPEPAPEPEVVPEPAEPTPPPATDGGTPAPQPEAPPDSPENDIPPPRGSPAERFEEFCDENPGACG
jgi:outer membrane biosynthesis protein TonB